MAEFSFCDCYRGLISSYVMPRDQARILLREILDRCCSARGSTAFRDPEAGDIDLNMMKAGGTNETEN